MAELIIVHHSALEDRMLFACRHGTTRHTFMTNGAPAFMMAIDMLRDQHRQTYPDCQCVPQRSRDIWIRLSIWRAVNDQDERPENLAAYEEWARAELSEATIEGGYRHVAMMRSLGCSTCDPAVETFHDEASHGEASRGVQRYRLIHIPPCPRATPQDKRQARAWLN